MAALTIVAQHYAEGGNGAQLGNITWDSTTEAVIVLFAGHDTHTNDRSGHTVTHSGTTFTKVVEVQDAEGSYPYHLRHAAIWVAESLATGMAYAQVTNSDQDSTAVWLEVKNYDAASNPVSSSSNTESTATTTSTATTGGEDMDQTISSSAKMVHAVMELLDDDGTTWLYDVISAYIAAATFTPGTGQTELKDDDRGSVSMAVSEKEISGSTTHERSSAPTAATTVAVTGEVTFERSSGPTAGTLVDIIGSTGTVFQRSSAPVAATTVDITASIIFGRSSAPTAGSLVTITGDVPSVFPVLASEQVTVDAASTGNFTMTAPSGINSGDLLVLLVKSEHVNDTDEMFGSLSGWTKAYEIGDESTADACVAMYWRISNGTEGATISVPLNGPSGADRLGWYQRWTGAHDTDPIINLGGGFSSEIVSSTGYIPGISTDLNNMAVVAHWAGDGADTYPYTLSGTGWATSPDQETTAGTGGTALGGGYVTREVATADDLIDLAVAMTVSDGFAGNMFGIRNNVAGTWNRSSALTAASRVMAPSRYPQLRSSSLTHASEWAASSPVTVPLPPWVEPGDLLVVMLGSDYSSAGTYFDTTTGWTLHYDEGDALADAYIGLYTKIADGTEGSSVDISLAIGGYDVIAFSQAWKHGHDIEVIGTTLLDSTGTSHTITGITTTSDHNIVTGHFAADGADTAPHVTSGTGWGTSPDRSEAVGDTNSAVSSGFITREVESAGAVPNLGVSTAVSDGLTGVMFSITPHFSRKSSIGASTAVDITGDTAAGTTFQRSSAPTAATTADVTGVVTFERASAPTAASTLNVTGQLTLDRSSAPTASTLVDVTGDTTTTFERSSGPTAATTVAVVGSRTQERASAPASGTTVTGTGVVGFERASAPSASTLLDITGDTSTTFERASGPSASTLVDATGQATFERLSAGVASSVVAIIGDTTTIFERSSATVASTVVDATGQVTLERSAGPSASSVVDVTGQATFERSATSAASSTVTAVGGVTTQRSSALSSVSSVDVLGHLANAERSSAGVAATSVSALGGVTILRSAAASAATTVDVLGTANLERSGSAAAATTVDVAVEVNRPRSSAAAAATTVGVAGGVTIQRSAASAAATTVAVAGTVTGLLERSCASSASTTVASVATVTRGRSAAASVDTTVDVTGIVELVRSVAAPASTTVEVSGGRVFNRSAASAGATTADVTPRVTRGRSGTAGASTTVAANATIFANRMALAAALTLVVIAGGVETQRSAAASASTTVSAEGGFRFALLAEAAGVVPTSAVSGAIVSDRADESSAVSASATSGSAVSSSASSGGTVSEMATSSSTVRGI